MSPIRRCPSTVFRQPTPGSKCGTVAFRFGLPVGSAGAPLAPKNGRLFVKSGQHEVLAHRVSCSHHRCESCANGARTAANRGFRPCEATSSAPGAITCSRPRVSGPSTERSETSESAFLLGRRGFFGVAARVHVVMPGCFFERLGHGLHAAGEGFLAEIDASEGS